MLNKLLCLEYIDHAHNISKMSAATPKALLKLLQDFRVTTPVCILLRATVQKEIELNASSSVCNQYILKIVTHLAHALFRFIIIYVGVTCSYLSFFSLNKVILIVHRYNFQYEHSCTVRFRLSNEQVVYNISL